METVVRVFLTAAAGLKGLIFLYVAAVMTARGRWEAGWLGVALALILVQRALFWGIWRTHRRGAAGW